MREARFVKPLSVNLSDEMYQKIKEVTDQERVSMAEWIRKIAEKAIFELENNNLKGGNDNVS